MKKKWNLIDPMYEFWPPIYHIQLIVRSRSVVECSVVRATVAINSKFRRYSIWQWPCPPISQPHIPTKHYYVRNATHRIDHRHTIVIIIVQQKSSNRFWFCVCFLFWSALCAYIFEMGWIYLMASFATIFIYTHHTSHSRCWRRHSRPITATPRNTSFVYILLPESIP